ncbi:MAG: ribose 5-phosphate isomerase B [Clostridiales bacterium]|nr:ribose 5-phosphate isomerase B [Clostridiales bacterium]
MKIAIGSDHAGYELKEKIKQYLIENNIEIIDVGTNSTESVDYPDFAYDVAKNVIDGNVDKGILICTTGIGIGIAANKVKGIRCGTCNDLVSAEMARKDNDINVVAIGSRFVDYELAEKIVDKFINTQFLGNEISGERHKRRVNKITEIENM